jgi:hypothetical protein
MFGTDGEDVRNRKEKESERGRERVKKRKKKEKERVGEIDFFFNYRSFQQSFTNESERFEVDRLLP